MPILLNKVIEPTTWISIVLLATYSLQGHHISVSYRYWLQVGYVYACLCIPTYGVYGYGEYVAIVFTYNYGGIYLSKFRYGIYYVFMVSTLWLGWLCVYGIYLITTYLRVNGIYVSTAMMTMYLLICL